jgi:hypothetical protein
LSIGVAHRQLVIEGVLTDSKHPVMSDLARRLHEHQLGAMSFKKGTQAREVEALLQEAAAGGDPTIEAMAGLALMVRAQRLSGRPPEQRKATDSGWVIPSLVCSSSLTVVQFGAVLGSQILNPGQLLPALILTPALALLAGVGFGVSTYPSVSRAALGGGASAFVGASVGICLGFLVAPALTPLALAVGGTVALGSGALGGNLVRSAFVGG